MFAAFGASSPFLPGLLQQRGLGPSEIGAVLAAGTAIRLLAGPGGGRLADRSGLPRRVLTGYLVASAIVALGYRIPGGFFVLLGIAVLHAAMLAPLVPLADALTLQAATAKPAGPRFDYGWVRGAGSAAFIVGTVLAGQCVERSGLAVVVWLTAGLLAFAALASLRVPDPKDGRAQSRAGGGAATDALALLRLPLFRRLMVVAALVGGSHALHDSFQVIRWSKAGISPGVAGLLWSEAVASEVLVFVVLGPPLLRRIGPRRAALLAAAAGVIRWSVSACTVAVPAMAVVQPLHGLTFAFLHLACMDVLARIVPPSLASTAQAFYGTVAVGSISALLTLASGPLYGRFGAEAFWAMALLCAVALPVAARLRLPTTRPEAAPATPSRAGW